MITILPERKPGAHFLQLGFFQNGGMYIFFFRFVVEYLPQRVDDHAVAAVIKAVAIFANPVNTHNKTLVFYSPGL